MARIVSATYSWILTDIIVGIRNEYKQQILKDWNMSLISWSSWI